MARPSPPPAPTRPSGYGTWPTPRTPCRSASRTTSCSRVAAFAGILADVTGAPIDVAFYSTYEWMGGKGSATKWFRTGLVSSDFQHLSKKGANKLADALYDSLMAGYERHAR